MIIVLYHTDTYLHADLNYRKDWTNTVIIIWYSAFSNVQRWKATQFLIGTFLHVAIGNKKYAIISNNNNATRMQVHYTKCSMDSVSSASIELIFSNFKNIHTKVRNLLGNSKAFKLAFCIWILRGSAELYY